MILKNKNAVIYGAGGSLGGAIALALAAAGAKVFLTGRNIGPVQAVADQIIAAGGNAEVDEVDALDENAVNNHIQRVTKLYGTIDISYNAIGVEAVQNRPLADMSTDDFMRPLTIGMRSFFLTATAAGRIMRHQQSGVILSLTASPGGIGYPGTGGFGPTCCAIESLSRNLASELGVYSVRVVNIRSGGSPDSKVFKEMIDSHPDVMEPILRNMKADTMLKRLPLMADIANTAVFLSSDLAGMITGVTVDVTGGTTAALNYKVSPLSS